MNPTEWICAVFVFLTAAVLAVLSIRSFGNRGFLLNNEYIYASKDERETMDKRPYYRQTGIVFLILSIVFVIIGLSIILQNARLNLLEIPLFAGAVIYAIVSSVRIGK